MVEHPIERNDSGGPKMVKANGIAEIRNFYGVRYGKRSVPIAGYWQRPIEDREALIFQAEDIVVHLVRKHEVRGLIDLTGDEGRDNVLKAEARKKFLAANREWAMNERNARAEFVEKYKKENPGAVSFPPPKKSQIRAEVLLLQAERNERQSAAQYRCECGMFEHDDRELFEMHLQARHGKSLPPIEVKPEPEIRIEDIPPDQLVTDESVFEPKKRGPGRRKEA
jgi:hypothetical protein